MAQNFTDNCFDSNNVAQTDLANIEQNFAAVKSQFSGTGAPANPVPGMPWVDLTRHMLCVRNEANSAWQDMFNLATGQPAGMSTNADTVDGIHASTTAVANKLLALNASAKMPCDITGSAASAAALSVASGVTAGTYYYGESAGPVAVNSASYTKVLSCRSQIAGTVRVRWTMRSDSGQFIYGKIYKNGVAAGVEKSVQNPDADTVFTDDITVVAGDIIQLYAKGYGPQIFGLLIGIASGYHAMQVCQDTRDGSSPLRSLE